VRDYVEKNGAASDKESLVLTAENSHYQAKVIIEDTMLGCSQVSFSARILLRSLR
jgi:hypothetical protein